ncbi:MAG: pectinesterase family protein [Phocaeicola sp.]
MKLKNMILCSMLPLAWTACSSEENLPPVEEVKPITFVAEINPYPDATKSEWSVGDRMGQYMLPTATQSIVSEWANRLYVAQTGGESANFSATHPFEYPADGSKVDFIGYYPYSDQIANGIYSINLADQTAGTTAHDLMRSISTAGLAQGAATELPLIFSHLLAKTVFRVIDESGAEVAPSSFALQGMNSAATCNLLVGSLHGSGSVAQIAPYQSASNLFSAIVLPGNLLDSHAISYMVEGEEYHFNLSESENSLTKWQAGYRYTFTITHHPHEAPSASVEIESGSIAPWQEEEYNDAVADLVLNYAIFPANEAVDVFKDGYLRLTFSGDAPQLGNSGKVKIFKAADHSLVDEIDMADTHSKLENSSLLHTKMDIIGAGTSSNRYRVVNYQPLTVEGNTVTIKLHSNKLDYNTAYYVLLDDKVIKHKDFLGIKNGAKWSFTTKKTPAIPTDANHTVTVGLDNATADFRTIQGAIDFLALNVNNNLQKTVFIQNGVYEELLFIRGINNLTFKGESRTGVQLRYDNYDDLNGGTGGSASISPSAAMGSSILQSGGRAILLLEMSDKIRFESLTIHNTHVKTGKGDQAEIIYANNDTRAIAFVSCDLLSCQDTLCLKGFCWYYDCMIAGDVDFIWGSVAAALFEKCEIRAVADGYILQARVADGNKGFVFLNCDLTTTGVATRMFLSRTAGNASYFDNITLANCKMAPIYATYGWGLSGGSSGTLPNPSVATLENGYKTYNCTDLAGNAVSIANAQHAYALSSAEFEAHFSNRSLILAAYADQAWFAE